MENKKRLTRTDFKTAEFKIAFEKYKPKLIGLFIVASLMLFAVLILLPKEVYGFLAFLPGTLIIIITGYIVRKIEINIIRDMEQ